MPQPKFSVQTTRKGKYQNEYLISVRLHRVNDYDAIQALERYMQEHGVGKREAIVTALRLLDNWTPLDMSAVSLNVGLVSRAMEKIAENLQQKVIDNIIQHVLQNTASSSDVRSVLEDVLSTMEFSGEKKTPARRKKQTAEDRAIVNFLEGI